MPTVEAWAIPDPDWDGDYNFDVDVDHPDPISVGDLLIAIVKGFGVASTTATADDAGYEVIEWTSDDRGSAILGKIADGDEDGVTLNMVLPGMSDVHGCIYRISDHGVSDVTADIIVARDDTAITETPQITGVTALSLIISTVYSKNGTIPVSPSGFTVGPVLNTQGGSSRLQSSYLEDSGSGTLGPYDWTNDAVVGTTIAIPPAAGGATITGSGTPAADDSAASGAAEREATASGTPSADAVAASGAAERELPGSGTPVAQAGTTSGAAERVLTCSGTLLSGASSTAGSASLQLRLLLIAAEGRELRDEEGALVASLANIAYEWYDKDTDTNGDPDMSGTFSTDAGGEATIQLPGTALISGQFGLLVLEHPSDNTVRGVYRIPVT